MVFRTILIMLLVLGALYFAWRMWSMVSGMASAASAVSLDGYHASPEMEFSGLDEGTTS
jgi:hypothetical protein